MKVQKNKTVDEYISSFPKDVKGKLETIRAVIKQIAPKAEEVICYGIPTFRLNENLVHFAGYKNHIGFYPTSSGVSEFKKEISKYKFSKGTIQFSLEEKLPVTLIKKIVKFRLKESLLKNK